MEGVKTVGIISKPGIPRGYELVPALIEWLEERGVRVRMDEQTAAYANGDKGLPRDQVATDDTQLVIVLGGDGTLLAAARALGGRQIPLLPVNLGGLGFLTAITAGEIYSALESGFRGEHRVGTRRMISCELRRGGKTIGQYDALNDVVITKASLARMIDIRTYVDEHYVCTYKADGLIVCTPTGSTAYSLSAGGPIIFPTVATLCITPICPHTLTNRPVLVPDSMAIRMRNLAENDMAYLTIDGQIGEPLQHQDEVVSSRSERKILLVRPPRMMYFDVLREKLSWGER
jgi:NAD+ kinase